MTNSNNTITTKQINKPMFFLKEGMMCEKNIPLNNYFNSIISTSNIKFDLGGITEPRPASP